MTACQFLPHPHSIDCLTRGDLMIASAKPAIPICLIAALILTLAAACAADVPVVLDGKPLAAIVVPVEGHPQVSEAAELLASCILGPDAVGAFTRGVSPHSDDRPTVEYESNRIVFRKKTWYLNFKQLLEHSRFPEKTFDLEGTDLLVLEEEVRRQGQIMRDHLTFLHGEITKKED